MQGRTKYYLNTSWWNITKEIVLVSFSILLSSWFSASYSQNLQIKQVKVANFDENAFASAVVDGQMFFCSDRSTKAMKNVTNENGTKFLNIYQVAIEKDKVKGKKIELPDVINNKLNQGPISFDKEKQKAYYSSNANINAEGDYKLELYAVDYLNGNFSNPVALKIIGSEFNSAHPIVIDKGQKMIFASDLNGESSKSDLFICNWEVDHWSTPKAIAKVNSASTETFPTFHNNILYFSSDREDGYGGLDLYKSEYIDGEFTTPELILEPINSQYDDFLYLVNDASSGYFSSNRKNGYDRVFYFDYQIPTPDTFEEQNVTFCYLFEDEESLDNDSLEYTWYFGDGNSTVGTSVKHCFESLGEYKVYCNIVDIRNMQTFDKAAEYDVSISATAPIIQWRKDESGNNLTIYVEHKYAKNTYLEWYWILNGDIIMDKTLLVNLNRTESIDVKLVCFDSKNKLPTVGLHKKLR